MDASGNTEMREFMDEMQQNGVECYEVLTRTVAYLMERVDLVLIGAEAVVESGSGNFQKSFVTENFRHLSKRLR